MPHSGIPRLSELSNLPEATELPSPEFPKSPRYSGSMPHSHPFFPTPKPKPPLNCRLSMPWSYLSLRFSGDTVPTAFPCPYLSFTPKQSFKTGLKSSKNLSSAFWLKSSIVSVLITIISGTSSIRRQHMKWIFGAGRWHRSLLSPLHTLTQ